jgi:hypothetical protein
VVILSLVRSRPDGNIGFLRLRNRINVLLSRAKHGMYLLGNAGKQPGNNCRALCTRVRVCIATHSADPSSNRSHLNALTSWIESINP